MTVHQNEKSVQQDQGRRIFEQMNKKKYIDSFYKINCIYFKNIN